MQTAVQRIWSPKGRWHIGDLAWGRFMHVGHESEWLTALWTDDNGDVLAWGWVELPGNLELMVDPTHSELAVEVLRWFDQVATATAEYTVTVLNSEIHLIAALIAVGYRPQSEGPFFNHSWMSLVDLPASPELPEGFTLRHVWKSDVERRALAHQSAFHPSRVSTESYRNVMAAWPYREDLDWIVEAPNGEFAAFALAWFDEINRVGELEPVGTAPAFRGVGLARAVSLAALHALKQAGADSAVVYPRGDSGYPVPARLYGGLGFVPQARSVTYTRGK